MLDTLRNRIILLSLMMAEQLGNRTFAMLYNLFSNSSFWSKPHPQGFDFSRASAATRRERLAIRSMRLHRLIVHRYERLEDWSVCQPRPASLYLGLHHQPSLIRLYLARSGVPTAVISRFPERSVSWINVLHPLFPKLDLIPVQRGVLKTVQARIEAGWHVVLLPDAPDAIVGSCFRLVEAGVPFVFFYPTVDADGTPRLYQQVYDGPSEREACASAFLSFIRQFNPDLAFLTVRWQPSAEPSRFSS